MLGVVPERAQLQAKEVSCWYRVEIQPEPSFLPATFVADGSFKKDD